MLNVGAMRSIVVYPDINAMKIRLENLWHDIGNYVVF